MRACASSSASFGFFWPTSAAWIAVAIVSPIAGHCGTRGRQSTSVSCSSDASAASTKFGPMSFVIATNSGERHSDVRFRPERFAGPANFHDVRACVSAAAAHWMNSHVALLLLLVERGVDREAPVPDRRDALAGRPRGQRAKADLADHLRLLRVDQHRGRRVRVDVAPSVPCENASAMSGQFQLRTAGGA